MSWYLLREKAPCTAAENMACDLHLLECVESGQITKPILRLYAWDKPSLSLGYHQKWRDTVDQGALKEHDVALVRRWTGGRGVLHDHGEITYSVIAPFTTPFKSRVTHNYQLIGAALERFTLLDEARGVMSEAIETAADVRTKRGLPCFASISQSEIESSGQKLIGSAQKLGKAGFLQHGSIPMIHRHDVLNAVTNTKEDVSGLMMGMADHYKRAGLEVPPREILEDRLIRAFGEIFATDFEDLIDLPDEAEVQRIASERFLDDAWTFRK